MEKQRKAPLIAFSVLWFLAMEALGIAGWFMRQGQVEDYARSSLTPPTAAFFAVWTLLFGLLAAAFVLLRLAGEKGTLVLLLGALNALWVAVYFVWASPMAALALLAGMIVLCFFAIARAFEVQPLAGWLLVPYALWLCFALVLTYFVAFMN
ncbi:MAG: tryptophan-rich sensory protein [Christensenellaceae bacterium]|nr:tryptophan-rich sensory protein [Christensenellaceae bacterium]